MKNEYSKKNGYKYFEEKEPTGEYVSYEVYECPANPYEYGKYIGKTPIYEQAVQAVQKAKEKGKNLFIKGVKHDGSRVMIL